jgi:hypothetical protein
VAFGTLLAIVFLPLDRNIGMVVSGVAVLAMIGSAFTLVGAIAARDLPAWRKNRWRFSMGQLLSFMLGVAMFLGALTAAQRDVSVGRMLLACGGFMVVTQIGYATYIHWSRERHFHAMNAQGRYRDWNTIADAASRGEGTLLVGKCHQIPTVWWTDQTIRSFDEALAAIEAGAMITVCPQRTRISEWLKSRYPAVMVFEVDPGRIPKSSAT